MATPRGSSTFRTAPASGPERVAAAVLMAGAFAVVLAALPFKAFDLDRFFVPKELALFVTAAAAAVFLLDRARQLAIGWVDVMLAGWLGLSVLSAAASSNWWLATRAVGVSLAGATVFWVARALGRTRLAYRVAAGLAGACIAASATALLQAYGLVDSDYISLSRAPGGTLGNRNFVAHLAAIGLPAIVLVVLESRRALGVILGALSVGVASWMLVLSRTRAAWLGLALAGGVLFVAAWRFRQLVLSGKGGRRIIFLIVCAGAGALAALTLPNRLRWRTESNPYLETALDVVNFREGSGRGRIIQFQNSLELALRRPVLGVGPGNWSVQYPRVAASGDPSLNSEGMTSNPWPSSDWAAFLSERGLPAFVLLVGIYLALGADALRKLVGARTATEAREALALAGTLLVTAVVGAFDAVLLLGAPSLIAWGLFGILAPPGSRWTLALSEATRHSLLVAAATIGAVLIVRSSSQIIAMSLYPEEGLRASPVRRLAAIRRASRADPGSYRIHMRAAKALAERGNCSEARKHARAARHLYPRAPEPGSILRRCR
ncbi:MAG: O-antigen ligase family protein [Gemmatimonadaceae bacterium]